MNSKSLRFLGFSISAFLLLISSLIIYAWLHYSPAGETYAASKVAHINLPHQLRNSNQHDEALRRNNGNPYILEIDAADSGALFYYGASHTQSPDHPQIADITEKWKSFNPTVALYEGRSRGFFYGSLIEPFAGLPEPALIHKLAREDDVLLYTLEPAYGDEVAELLELYSPQQVALYFFHRVYRSEAAGSAKESLAMDLLGKRTDVNGLRGALKSLEDIDQLWSRDFPDQEDWRTIQHEAGYLADISVDSRRIRGEHMARILIDLVQQGERVFATVGSGHVIRQEWNLRSTFAQEPAWDQPDLEENS